MLLEKYKEDTKKLNEILQSGEVHPEEKESLYKLLIDENQSNYTKYLVWQLIKKQEKLFDIELLSRILKLPEVVTKNIFKNEPIKVKFPIALNNGKIATAYLIPLKQDTDKLSFCIEEDINEGLNTIKTILKKKNKEKNFFVIFDENFTGKSFMLSVISGLLLPEENIENYAFTGVLNEEGEIFPVGYIEDKKRVAKENELKLISYEIVDTIDELIYWLGNEPVDIPFVFLIGKPKEEVINSLKKLEKNIKQTKPYFSLKGLEKIFDLKIENLTAYYPKFLPQLKEDEILKENLWQEQVKKFEEKLRTINTKIEKKERIIHIALGIPVSLAMAFGIKFGVRKPAVIYHYQSDEYVPVMDLSTKRTLRKIKYIRKNIDENLNNIDVILPKQIINDKDVAVAIWLASHSPYADVENYLKSNGKNWNILKIESKEFQGDIPFPDDFEELGKDYWIRYVSEIYSVLNILKDRYLIDRYHFFLSVPVPIGFALGMAIGHFLEGIIYSFNIGQNVKTEERYFPVFNIKDKRLRSIF